MQSSVNQIEQQKSQLRTQIEQIKHAIFEDQDAVDYQDQRKMERELKERGIASEIQELQLKLEDLK
jgi:hypothetical protein